MLNVECICWRNEMEGNMSCSRKNKMNSEKKEQPEMKEK